MRRESAVESYKNDRRCTLRCRLSVGCLNFGELLPTQSQWLFHVHMPSAAQSFHCEPRMAVVSRSDNECVDFLLCEQLVGTCGSFGEAELLSVVNGIQA